MTFTQDTPDEAERCPECQEQIDPQAMPVVRWRRVRWHKSCALVNGYVEPLDGDNDDLYFGAAGTPRSQR
jgi:hypothetical protein